MVVRPSARLYAIEDLSNVSNLLRSSKSEALVVFGTPFRCAVGYVFVSGRMPFWSGRSWCPNESSCERFDNVASVSYSSRLPVIGSWLGVVGTLLIGGCGRAEIFLRGGSDGKLLLTGVRGGGAGGCDHA